MRERLPNRRISETLDFQVGKTLYTATLGYYEDAGKSGMEPPHNPAPATQEAML